MKNVIRGEFGDESRKRAFNDIDEVMDYDVTFDYDMINESGNMYEEEMVMVSKASM
mgnify:CR=1 FL=1